MENNHLLDTYLRRLRLPTFVDNYQSFSADAIQSQMSYPRYLLALTEYEIQNREQNAIRRLVKNASFPTRKELADFDFSRLPSLNKALILDLAEGEFIHRKRSLIFVGNPGLGKTHLMTALALQACNKGKKVRFWTAAALVNELMAAQDEHRLHCFIRAALKLDLIVLDELGFIPFTPVGAQVLFTFFSEMYERVALGITTNLHFSEWVQVFGDERLTAALLDRLTHHAIIVELKGESYRFRQRLSQDGDQPL